jgi:acetoin utilization protein AcuB
MNVKQRMTPNPVTVSPKTTYHEAVRLMEDNNIRRLPVLDKQGHLIGLVSQSDLLSTAPSQATTLSIYEIYTLLGRITVDQIMTTPVLAVDENCSLAAAAQLMLDQTVGALPVMRSDRLVGIITETDIFKTFVEVLGGGEPGVRVDLHVSDERGQLAAIAKACADVGGNIVTVTTFDAGDSSYGVISIKERGADEEKLRQALTALPGVELVEFRPHMQECALEFGRKK